MILEIVSPEATLFSGEVNSVTVPGTDGEFQVLNDHAAIVSLLSKGKVKIGGDVQIEKAFASKFVKENGQTTLQIESGTVEVNGNKVVVLAD